MGVDILTIRANNPVLKNRRMWTKLNIAFDSLERTIEDECKKLNETLETMAEVPHMGNAVCTIMMV